MVTVPGRVLEQAPMLRPQHHVEPVSLAGCDKRDNCKILDDQETSRRTTK